MGERTQQHSELLQFERLYPAFLLFGNRPCDNIYDDASAALRLLSTESIDHARFVSEGCLPMTAGGGEIGTVMVYLTKNRETSR
jgi:hypothetical protein